MAARLAWVDSLGFFWRLGEGDVRGRGGRVGYGEAFFRVAGEVGTIVPAGCGLGVDLVKCSWPGLSGWRVNFAVPALND